MLFVNASLGCCNCTEKRLDLDVCTCKKKRWRREKGATVVEEEEEVVVVVVGRGRIRL